MSETLRFASAVILEGKVKIFGCDKPRAVTLESTKRELPDPEAPAVLECKIKSALDLENISCSAADGSPCPLDFNVKKLQALRRE